MTEHSAAQSLGAIQRVGTVVFNQPIARDTYRIRIREPEIARRILPGQFVMVRVPGRTDPLLARPFALYDTVDDDAGYSVGIDLVYLVIGNGTRCLSTLAIDSQVVAWGPLGNTFPVGLAPNENRHLLIVAGGIGQTPFLAVIKELLGLRRYQAGRDVRRPDQITFAYGVRSEDYLGGIDEFRETGVTVYLATDDGSVGHRGYVTDLLENAFASADPPTAVFGCGPWPMLRRLAELAKRHEVPCWISLENKMACGYGVCFSCVCPVLEDNGWDYHRICTEGPVFRSDQIAWQEW